MFEIKDVIYRMTTAIGVETEKRLVKELGVSPPTFNRWKMRGEIPLSYIAAVALFCDVSLDWLLLGKAGPRETRSISTEEIVAQQAVLKSGELRKLTKTIENTSDRSVPFGHMDPAFAKLVTVALAGTEGDEPSLADVLNVALRTLRYDEDDKAASQILMSILYHDDLAEAIDGRL